MISVLDHGFVRLVEHMGSDVSIVRAARVSYDAAWRAGENEGSDAKLIRYLWKNKHTTPFEAVEFTFEVYAPIFVFRQWHRHRTWSYNELSGRYRELPATFYMPKPEHIGQQSKSNKQARDFGNQTCADHFDTLHLYQRHCVEAFKLYRYLLEVQQWPRELARGVLPLCTYSHMFAKVDLKNLFHFLSLRMDEHAQFEIREYAKALLVLIEPVVPVAVGAWRGA